MDSRKVFYILLSLIAISIASLCGVVVLGNRVLTTQSNNLTALKAENLVLEKQQADLLKARSDIARYENLEEITQSIVPQDKDQARAVREIVTLANQSGIQLKSITFPASNLGTRPQGQRPAEGEQTPQQSATPTISQAKPVEGIKGIYSLELTIVPENRISYYQFIEFLAKLEKNRRTSQVSRIKIEPVSTDNRNPLITFTLTLNIFVKP